MFLFLAFLATGIAWWIDENRSAKPQIVSAKEMDRLLERDTID